MNLLSGLYKVSPEELRKRVKRENPKRMRGELAVMSDREKTPQLNP